METGELARLVTLVTDHRFPKEKFFGSLESKGARCGTTKPESETRGRQKKRKEQRKKSNENPKTEERHANRIGWHQHRSKLVRVTKRVFFLHSSKQE